MANASMRKTKGHVPASTAARLMKRAGGPEMSLQALRPAESLLSASSKILVTVIPLLVVSGVQGMVQDRSYRVYYRTCFMLGLSSTSVCW